jgi:monoamine oxidase
MIGFIKKLFGAKDTAPAPTPAEAPYKIDTSSINPMSPVAVPVVEAAPAPVVDAVVIVAEAVAPTAVVEPAPAKKPAPKKQQPAKKPAAPKTAKPKATPKPKAKPAA